MPTVKEHHQANQPCEVDPNQSCSPLEMIRQIHHAITGNPFTGEKGLLEIQREHHRALFGYERENGEKVPGIVEEQRQLKQGKVFLRGMLFSGLVFGGILGIISKDALIALFNKAIHR